MSTHHLILLGYARSGITLINRYLAADPRLICLSEINSRYKCPTLPNTIRDQLREWYNMSVESNTFSGALAELFDTLIAGRAVVLRDWSFGSFINFRHNNFQPSMTLNTIDDTDTVFPGMFEKACFVRNPIDVWLSMKSSEKTFHDNTLEGYYLFTQDILTRNIKVATYESFCDNPNQALSALYTTLALPSSRHLALSDKVTGDINYPNSSRGAAKATAEVLPVRGLTPSDAIYLTRNTYCREICRLLNYPFDLERRIQNGSTVTDS